MALYTFGGTPADVLTDAVGNVVPDGAVVVRRAGTGEPVTALYEVDGVTPIGTLRSDPAGSAAPGAVRLFKARDVSEIEYEYHGPSGGTPVRRYQQARETASAALSTARSALAGPDTRLPLTGGTVTGPTAFAAGAPVTFTGPVSAPGLTDLPGARVFLVTGAVGDGVADDRAAIQAALDAAHTAGGGQVLVPAGRIYGVTDFLTVYEKTTIWAYGATIRAIGNTGILRNFLADDSFAGYEGRGSIQVLGGLWDGNAAHAGVGTVTAMTNVISWMHAADITVRDATVRNTSSAHGIELNSIDGGRVLNCRIEGFKDNSAAGNRGFSEAIQIDLARAGSGSIGLNDNTPARNILIQGCYVGPSSRLGLFGRAFGSHTLVAGTYYDGIQAVDNKIDGTMHEGIYAFGWCRSVISGNIIDNPGHAGIEIAVPDPALGYTLTPYAIAVTGNIVDAPGSESAIRAVGHPTAKLSGVRVDSNTIRSSGGNGLQIEHCVSSGVTSNTVESTASTGIFVNYSDGASVDGNTIRNAGSNAINASGSVSVAITANHIDGTAGNHGIAIGPGADGTNGQDAVITGNKIRRAASAGIRLSANATGCLVTGNQIRRDGGTTANGISLAAGATGAVVMDNDLSGNGWNAATALLVSTAAPITGMGETTALPGTNVVDTDLTPGTALEAAMRPAGRYETTSRLRCGTSSAPTSGTLNLVPIWLPQGLLISNIAFTSGGTAASLPLNCWFTLHDASRVALARTADQTTAAWAAHTTKTLAVAQTSAGTAGSCTTTYAGLHYLGVMITATAPPALVGEGSTLLGATAPGLGATNTLQTTPPNVTGGAFTAAAFTGNAILAYAYVT